MKVQSNFSSENLSQVALHLVHKTYLLQIHQSVRTEIIPLVQQVCDQCNTYGAETVGQRHPCGPINDTTVNKNLSVASNTVQYKYMSLNGMKAVRTSKFSHSRTIVLSRY